MLKYNLGRKAPQFCAGQYKQYFIKIATLHTKESMIFSAFKCVLYSLFYTYTHCIAQTGK